MFEDELRSATVEAIEPTSVVGVLGPDMRRLMTEHPEIALRLVIALGRRLRETNERLSRQSFQTVQSRVAVVLSDLVAQQVAAGHGRLRTCSLRQRRPTSRSSPGPRASPRAASWRCSSVPASSSQGRGRLVVHDPGALSSYVF